MKIFGSKVVVGMVCLNVVLGAIALFVDWLARRMYWPHEPPGPHVGLVQVASGEIPEGDIRVKCFAGFGEGVPHFKAEITQSTNTVTFTCENVFTNGCIAENRFYMKSDHLDAEWRGDLTDMTRVRKINVSGRTVYPFGRETKIIRWFEDHPYKVTSTNATTKVGE